MAVLWGRVAGRLDASIGGYLCAPCGGRLCGPVALPCGAAICGPVGLSLGGYIPWRLCPALPPVVAPCGPALLGHSPKENPHRLGQGSGGLGYGGRGLNALP